MSDNAPHSSSTYRVRPALRGFAIAAFAVLLPLAAHSLWDYVETRRLVREVEAIRARGEPVTEWDAVGSRPLASEPSGAAAYYLAGAMLAMGTSPSPSGSAALIHEWLLEPRPDRDTLQRLAEPLHELVKGSSDALLLADKAAALPFDGFPEGTDYSYRAAGVGRLLRLVSARTLSLSQSGNADAAVDSAISELRARRALRDASWRATGSHDVAAVLSLTGPSPEALIRLQAALEAEDDPERPLEHFLRERARYLWLVWRRSYGTSPNNAPRYYTFPLRGVMDTLLRPMVTRSNVHTLRLWAQLTDVVRRPWPERIRLGAEMLEGREELPPVVVGGASFSQTLNDDFALSAFSRAVDATQLVQDRAAIVAVAIERFRRDRNALPSALTDLVPQYLRAVPEDPYSGQPLLFRQDDVAYTVYSVGANQQDDAGELWSQRQRIERRRPGIRVPGGADIGVRVLLLLDN